MQETAALGGLTGYPYGLVIAVAACLQLLLMHMFAHRQSLPAGSVPFFGIAAIPLGLFFSRLLFCLVNVSLFTETYENPWLMLRFFDGGLSMSGLIFGILAAALLSSRLLKIPYARLLDAVTLPLGLFLGLCRAGEYFTELGVGKIWREGFLTQYAPWLFFAESAGIATEYRLAVYVYEAITGLLIFLAMLYFSRQIKKHPLARPGDASLLFLTLYGSTQIFWESMRDDGHLLFTFLRVAQVLAFFMPLTALLLFSRRYTSRVKSHVYLRITWSLFFLCTAALVLLEFSMDGRLSWGIPSLARDYCLMSVSCILLFLAPYSIWKKSITPFSQNSRKGDSE